MAEYEIRISGVHYGADGAPSFIFIDVAKVIFFHCGSRIFPHFFPLFTLHSPGYCLSE